MANSFFQFKQFIIRQEYCAMKVGTDGVLLGAWASVERSRHVLDVGTGSGLIALMAAQRSEAFVDAIDLDESACLQATLNGDSSPFADRIRIHHTSFYDFRHATNQRYDRIISNPPYFDHSLKCPDQQRSTARHTDTLPLDELIAGSLDLLAEAGRICLILPSDREETLKQLVTTHHLHIVRQTNVVPVPGTSPKRMLVEIAHAPQPGFQIAHLTIELSRHVYSPEYIRLTKDFYLKM